MFMNQLLNNLIIKINFYFLTENSVNKKLSWFLYFLGLLQLYNLWNKKLVDFICELV